MSLSRLILHCWPLVLLFGTAPLAHAEPLRIGAEDDWYPYTALRNGEVQGMSVDIVKEAFAATSTEIELLPYPYARCMQLTLKGELVACFNTAPNAQIALDYQLPKTALFHDDILLWARSTQATPLNALEQLAGKRVAVTIGYEYGERFDSNQKLVRVPVRQDRNGFLMLQRQRVDYVVAYRGTATHLFQQYTELAGQFSPVATVHEPQLHLSFSRHAAHATEALQRFEQGMRLIQDNGRYQQILQDWQHGSADSALPRYTAKTPVATP